MINAIFLSILFGLTSVSAFAGQLALENSGESAQCEQTVQRIQSLGSVTVTENLRASFETAVLRAMKLTEEARIQPRYVTSRSMGFYRENQSEIGGIFIRVSDNSDPAQANAYEFLFKIQNTNGVVALSLLTVRDDWHTHGENKTLFLCE